ncbi:MAG: hypothetical protein KDB22_03005 [Planctomycetales bacterium]|nr:hypothetical protein [Planctomycetales bacterium]
MKTVSRIVAGIAIAIGLGMTAYALERNTAVSETLDALALIDSGRDWDGTTPISQEQQTERLQSNTDVLRNQKSQRTTSGLLGLLLIAGGTAGLIVGPRFLKDQTTPSAIPA